MESVISKINAEKEFNNDEGGIVIVDDEDDDIKDFEQFTKEMTRIIELKEDLKMPSSNCNNGNLNKSLGSSCSSANNSFHYLNTNIWSTKDKKDKEDSGVFLKNYEKIKKGKQKKKWLQKEISEPSSLNSPELKSVSTAYSNRRNSGDSVTANFFNGVNGVNGFEFFPHNYPVYNQLIGNCANRRLTFPMEMPKNTYNMLNLTQNLKENYKASTPLKKYANCPLNTKLTPSQKANHIDDISNRINIENIIRGKDKRTTLMIRHIPNKYNLQTLVEDINAECKGKFDVFYLPIDYLNNCNLGFAFINFVEPMHILQFYETFRGKKWKRFSNSEKICELAYAKFQGKKELIAHFEKGSVLNFDAEEKKPLILPTPNPLPAIEIPLKYFESFIAIYPYADCHILQTKFVVKSLFAF